jgi:hypothetical protein
MRSKLSMPEGGNDHRSHSFRLGQAEISSAFNSLRTDVPAYCFTLRNNLRRTRRWRPPREMRIRDLEHTRDK